MNPDTEIALPFELSDAELDAVHGGHGGHHGGHGGHGGHTIVGGLGAILAQVLHGLQTIGGGGFVATQISFNIAAGNTIGGNFTQMTGDQIIAIG
jgi:acetylornithine deacetylase/succinyl-diaminopimelate desuccinylase-like protein